MSTNTLSRSSVVTDETVDAISDTLYNYFTLSQCWSVYEDVDVLSTIKEAGYIIGAVSNFDDRLGTGLTLFGLMWF